MNILLIEDDLDQAQQVMHRIQNQNKNNVKVIGPYSKFAEILSTIKSQQFQMALIDIELHQDRYAGLHIAEAIQEFHPVPILFVSGATEQDVIERAGKISSSDFLQKPYDEQSFSRALDHVTKRIHLDYSGSFQRIFRPRNKDRYWIKSERSIYVKVDPKHIVCVEALDHYCRFYVQNHRPIITGARLKSEVFERGLAELGSFYLLNRSTIINLDQVDRIDGNCVVMKDFTPLGDKRFIVSKERRKELFDLLGIYPI